MVLKRVTEAGAFKNHFLFEDRRDELNDFSEGVGNAGTIRSTGDVSGFRFCVASKMKHEYSNH